MKARAGLALLALMVVVGGVGCGLNMERNYQNLRPKLLDHDY